MVRDLPSNSRAGEAIFSYQETGGGSGGGTHLLSQQRNCRVPVELAEACGEPADWLLLSCGFPENCLVNSVPF